MDDKFITCVSVGVYSHALSRGKSYEVYDYKDNKFRLVGDHGKRIWIHEGHLN